MVHATAREIEAEVLADHRQAPLLPIAIDRPIHGVVAGRSEAMGADHLSPETVRDKAFEVAAPADQRVDRQAHRSLSPARRWGSLSSP